MNVFQLKLVHFLLLWSSWAARGITAAPLPQCPSYDDNNAGGIDICDPRHLMKKAEENDAGIEDLNNAALILKDSGDDFAVPAVAAFEDLICEIQRSHDAYTEAVNAHCQDMSMGFDVPAGTARQTCSPDLPTAIQTLEDTLPALVAAVTFADLAIEQNKDEGHIAAWAALQIIVGEGSGLPSSTAMRVAFNVSTTAQGALNFAKHALETINFALAIIKFNSSASGCHFQTTKTTHDVSFETFELADNYLAFISCPYRQTLTELGQNPRPLMRAINRGGCDGIDNDCDSAILASFIDANNQRQTQDVVKRVDECDEDRVPPTLILTKDPPSSFLNQVQAVQWFEDNTIASDDCVPTQALSKQVIERNIIGEVTFQVTDPRCIVKIDANNLPINDVATVNGVQNVVVDGPGEPLTERTFTFVVDECPFLPYAVTKNPAQGQRPILNGEGCDGLDNDCDSNFLNLAGNLRVSMEKRVDECDEDRVPPIITLTKDPPPSFPTEAEAVAFFEDNTVASDDCVPSNLLNKFVQNVQTDTSGNGSVDIVVQDTRCVGQQVERGSVNGVENVIVDGPGASETVKSFTFVVDGVGPTVTCGFHKPQNINFVADPTFVPDGLTTPPEPVGDASDPLFIDFNYDYKDLVNVEFWYNVEENPPVTAGSGETMNVSVKVKTNELEVNGRDMAMSFKRESLPATQGQDSPVDRLSVFLSPHSCQDSGADASRRTNCLVERDVNQNGIKKDFSTRFYDIVVTATDPSGNEGIATCTVIVVPENYWCGSSKSAKSCKTTKKRKHNQSPNLPVVAPSKGKGGKSFVPPKDLIDEYSKSRQRFCVDSFKLEWSTEDDTNPLLATPAPSAAPSGKGKGKGISKSQGRERHLLYAKEKIIDEDGEPRGVSIDGNGVQGTWEVSPEEE